MKAISTLKKLKQDPIDKAEFKSALTETNIKRSLAGVLMLTLFSFMMFRGQYYSSLYNDDLVTRERSIVLFEYSKVCMATAIICIVLYLVSWKMNLNENIKLFLSWIQYMAVLLFGASTSVAMFLVDGEPFYSFYITFTLFACLIFVVKPVTSLFSLLLVNVSSYYMYDFLPKKFGFALLDDVTKSFIYETILCVVILSFGLSLILYYGYLKAFNQNYIIKQLNQELLWCNKRDALTEIYNRKEFAEQLTEKMNRMAEEKSWISIAILDIDFFKQYNDTYGHLEGDTCLKKVAKCLQESIDELAPEGIAARYGGEEFTIAIERLTPKEAQRVVEEVLSNVRALQILHEGSEISQYLTMSAGLYSMIPALDFNLSKSLNYADELLYKAKEAGRDCLMFEQVE